ncbi:MAG: FtsX-like permease family protein [Clostridiales bacterium]|nr:FtsX-like permease family protein [Clostridiales bacterium]
MRDPMNKRFLREFAKDWKKNLALILLMSFMIALASGMEVGNKSMLKSIEASSETYNLEDGHFILKTEGSDALLKKIEEENNLKIYKQYYKEVDQVTEESKKAAEPDLIRVFPERTEVNKICLMDGRFPEAEDEIVIDRLHAEIRKINIGDTIGVDGLNLKVVGTIAAPDYTSLFQRNSDLVFNSISFDIGFMTQAGWDKLNGSRKFEYAYIYNDEPSNVKEQKKLADSAMQKIAVLAATGGYTSDLSVAKALESDPSSMVALQDYMADMNELMDFLPEYANQAIHFAPNDMKKDTNIMGIMVYIFIAILAFVFAITTSNTIVKEAAVIGTLRSTGYTRGELLRHYMLTPVLITIVSAAIGNLLGYTLAKDVVVNMYYENYCMIKYQTYWNAKAFLITTLIPLVLMILINFIIIFRKLRLSPLKFLRRDLSTSKRKKAMRLPRVGFMNRFRMRIFLQNIGSYIVLYVGIAFVMLLLAFTIGLPETIEHYKSEIKDNQISEYQYILKNSKDEAGNEITTSEETAERYAISSLETISGVHVGEEVSVIGVSKDSRFVKGTEGLTGNEVLVSSAFKEKFGLKNGSTLTLGDKYSDETYDFVIKGVYEYQGGIGIFMPIENYNTYFGLDEGTFTGYLAANAITDIDVDNIYMTITLEDIQATAVQFDRSMGGMMDYISVGCAVLAILIIFLLTKLIIEKNAVSISMVKVLGYENREINSLYVRLTTILVIIFAIGTSFLAVLGLKLLFKLVMYTMNGWFSGYISPLGMVKMIAIMIICYLIVMVFDMRRIKKIPLADALKNVE